MWNAIKNKLGELLSSKKALATIASLLTIGLSKAGIAIEPSTMQWVVGSLGAYVVGQGLADIGKEKAKVESSFSTAMKAKPLPRGKK